MTYINQLKYQWYLPYLGPFIARKQRRKMYKIIVWMTRNSYSIYRKKQKPQEIPKYIVATNRSNQERKNNITLPDVLVHFDKLLRI